MTMRGRYMVEKPDDIEMTAKITMTMKEWCELRDQLFNAYPAWKLTGMITEMLTDARRVYYSKPDGDGDDS